MSERNNVNSVCQEGVVWIVPYLASYANALRARHTFLTHTRLFNGLVTSIHQWLAFVLKEPICCYLFDTSVI